MVSKQFTLGKNERLKSRKQIEGLFNNGKSFNLFPFKVYYFLSQLTSHDSRLTIQFGVGVSGKNFRRAVGRNRIKRLIREAYRLQKLSLQQKLKEKKLQLNLFFIYIDKELPDFNFIKEKLAVALNKLKIIIDENISSHS